MSAQGREFIYFHTNIYPTFIPVRRKIIPYNPNLKTLARKLRNDSTLGEALLWRELNNGQMYGFDFHRQKPLLNYIVDFYCYELELIIEVDGQYHTWEEQADKNTFAKMNWEIVA